MRRTRMRQAAPRTRPLLDALQSAEQDPTRQATDPLRWTGLMNNLRHSAEELVLSDLIYA